jgi:hypothetical protein
MASIRYTDVGLSLIGGVLFLRLINPAIVNPKKFGVIKGDVTADGQRAMLIASKVLQRLANEQTFEEDLEPSMVFANRFIKSELPSWKSFFHKFITGSEVMSSSTAVKFDIAPEDLINEANQDIMHVLVCPIVKSKQKEMFHRLFQLEKQTSDWEPEENDGVMTKYKKFKGSSIFVMSTEVVLPGTAEDFVNILRNICSTTSQTEIAIGKDSDFERNILVEYNENLRVVHTVHKAHPLFKARDFVTLNHLQTVPEENFAITCCASIEKEEYPKVKGCIRGDILHGCIFRGHSDGTTTVSLLIHLDAKGMGKVAPGFLLKKGLFKTHSDFIRMFKENLPTATTSNRKSTM